MAPKNADALKWDDADAVLVGRDDISDFNEPNILPESQKVQDSILEWLQPTEYDRENGEYRRHRASHLRGTGSWLISSSVYQEWHDSKTHGTLWIKGIPGSGKSVVAASLVEKLSQEAPVLYFFFRQIITANHTPTALLRDWLAQVLVYSPPLQTKLKEHVKEHKQLSAMSIMDLWKDLRLALAYLPKVYCVVDALDEMDEGNDEFLQSLTALGRWRPEHVKIVMTSRPVASVERPLRGEPILQLRLEKQHIQHDIAEYVAHRISQSSKQIESSEKEDIKNEVSFRAAGLFLYAKLSMDALLEEQADVQSVLQTLPKDLNVVYTELLREHARRSGVSPHLQLLVLSCATHASRSLRLLELADMIRVVEPEHAPTELKDIKQLVRSACGPLLEILPDETISVVHHSLTEFLNGSTRPTCDESEQDSYPVLEHASTHRRLALACLAYLQSGCLDGVKLGDADDYDYSTDWGDYYVAPAVNRELPLRYPFLAYSRDNWHIHARKAEGEDPQSSDLTDQIQGLLSGHNLAAYQTLSLGGTWTEETNPLHIAASLGMLSYVARLASKDGVKIDQVDNNGHTPIWHAVGHKHTYVVRLLLDQGADTLQVCPRGRTLLHQAAVGNGSDIAQMLLVAGADPLAPKSRPDPGMECGDPERTMGQTPLMDAMKHGSESVVRAFLPYLNDSETVSRALQWALEGGPERNVALILQHPLVDVNAKVCGETPLHAAARRPLFKSVLALLEAGADPCIASGSAIPEFSRVPRRRLNKKAARSERTVLIALLKSCRNSWSPSSQLNRLNEQDPELLVDCVHVLLRKGVDVNAKDKYGDTALYYASNWAPHLVRLLLRAGANTSPDPRTGVSLLHECRNVETIRILVEEGGMNINCRRLRDGHTPLLSVVGKELSADMVRIYADLGADLNLTTSDGQNALHLFIRGVTSTIIRPGEMETLEALLNAGVSPNTADVQGLTPMHLIKELYAYDDMATRLLAAGSDPNARDHKGRTPIFYRVQSTPGSLTTEEYLSRLHELEEQGFNLDVVDNQGQSLLFVKMWQRETHQMPMALIDALIAYGLDPKARDYQGKTLLHRPHVFSPSRSSSSRAEKLVALGVDLNQQDFAGRSPLHYLADRNQSEYRAPDTQITLFENPDIKDNAGVRPLHIAAKSGEDYVAALLAAGASPVEPTSEGITPLHVAVRFRQSNIVGMLLAAIKAQFGADELAWHLNSFHRAHTPTVLQWACRAGMPETVALLLAAGANPNQISRIWSDETNLSPLEWCTQFEDEDRLWILKQGRAESSTEAADRAAEKGEPAAGIGLHDKYRAYGGFWTEKRRETRLEDILDMLHEHGAEVTVPVQGLDGSTRLDNAIALCGSGKDYTVECLLDFALRMGAKSAPAEAGPDVSAPSPGQTRTEIYVDSLYRNGPPMFGSPEYAMATSVHRGAASRRAFIMAEPWKQAWNNGQPSKEMIKVLKELAAQRDWASFKTVLNHGPRLCGSPIGLAIIAQFVADGHVSLVREMINRDEIQQLQTELQSGLQKSKTEGQCLSDRSMELRFLRDACGRGSWNMPMLRFLVEELGVEINGTEYRWKGGQRVGKYLAWRNALSTLALGEEWWQVAEGLPYLIEHGADLNMRVSYGNGGTALNQALSRKYTFGTQAAKLLIQAGADVNATDDEGQNCLARTSGKPDLQRLLLQGGAKVSPLALSQAVFELDLAGVKAFLENGADPNGIEQPGVPSSYIRQLADIAPGGLPPLFLAAVHSVPTKPFAPLDLNELTGTRWPFLYMLLDHGADPFAKFIQPYEGKAAQTGDEVVVLHHILREGGIVQPILEQPDLDLEHKDAHGRTVLLAACGSLANQDYRLKYAHCASWKTDRLLPGAGEAVSPTTIEYLLDKGASLSARDNKERNVLHHILEVPKFGGYESLQMLISRDRSLLSQVDVNGDTPFHYALRRVSLERHPCLDTQAIEVLLTAGVDPHQRDAAGNTALHLLGKWLGTRSTPSRGLDKPRQLFTHLVSQGLDINARNADGETPAFAYMHHMSEYPMPPDVDDAETQLAGLATLADAGADFGAVNARGETLLHVIAATDKDRWRNSDRASNVLPLMMPRFRWLLDRGVDAAVEDMDNRTCLDVAAARGHTDIIKLFEREES